MADNFVTPSGSGGATFGSDEVTRAAVVQQIPFVKLMDGTADSTAIIPGDATNGLKVNVSTMVSLPAGTAAVGTFTVNNGAGASSVPVQGPDAADAAVTRNPFVMAGYGSSTTPTAMSANGDVTAFWCDLSGRGQINLSQIGGTSPNLGSGTIAAGTLRVVLATDQPAVTVTGAATVQATVSNTVTITGAATVQATVSNTVTVTGAATVSGTVTAIGTVSTLQAGTWTSQGFTAADAPVAGNPFIMGGYGSSTTPTAMSANGDATPLWTDLSGRPQINLSQIGGIAPNLGSGTIATGTQRVVLATDQPAVTITGAATASGTVSALQAGTWTSQGFTAADAPVAGNPFVQAFYGSATLPTAMSANGDVSRGYSDLYGRQVVIKYAADGDYIKGSTTSVTNTTATQIIAAPGSGLTNYITTLAVQNGHTTVGTWVKFTDGATGGTEYQVYCAAAGGGANITFDPPLKQTTANTAFHFVCETTGSDTRASARGFKAP